MDRSVSHYKFVERLGAGGMGEIFKAHDARLNRTVAVKMVSVGSSDDIEKRRRFLQEARAASGLNHPNIITVHDLVSDQDSEFLVMEFISGETLADKVQKGPMPPAEVIDYAIQISDALAAAHGANIVHRDIKPGNIMVTANGLVKVLDFGLAKQTYSESLDPNEATRTMFAPMTVEGSILGTVSYMSPEQAEGKPVDARSDIFSFGSVLYEVITGQKAFKGGSALSTLSAILRDDVRPIPELAKNVPASLVQLVQRCLAKDPANRWQSMREVNTELKRIKDLSGSSQMAAVATPSVPRRNPKWVNALAIALPAVILLGVFWFLNNRASTPSAPAPAATATEAAADVKPADDSLTNQSVIDMVKAKVPASVIVSHVRTAPFTNFDVSTAELIRLGQEGVPEPVIQAMSSRWRLTPPASKQGSAATGAPKSTATGAPPAAPASGTPVPGGAAPAVAPIVAPVPATIGKGPSKPQFELKDGTPFEMILRESIPETASVGTSVGFTAKQDIRVNEAVVIPAGAAVRGEIVDAGKSRFPGMGGKLMFRLLDVSTGAATIKLRAIPGHQAPDDRRSLENLRSKPSKGMAADAGSVYIAYVDGNQSVAAAR